MKYKTCKVHSSFEHTGKAMKHYPKRLLSFYLRCSVLSIEESKTRFPEFLKFRESLKHGGALVLSAPYETE
jgi:hypothetical protein